MYTSLGVLPPSAWLGLCSLNHARYTVSSRRMASSASGTRIRRVHSFFVERMNRSITAMLPCCWTAPKRGLMPRRWHQFLNEAHQNCVPLSEITYLGALPTSPIARSSSRCISRAVGRFTNTAKPTTAREK